MTQIIESVKSSLENFMVFDNSDKNAIIPVNYEIDSDSKIVFVVGSNASGKSLVGKIIEMVCDESDIVKRSCSMRNRTSGMLGQMMIFGDERDNSTGENSINALNLGLNSTVKEIGSVLIMDEPDIGLADEFSAAMGQYIAQKVNEYYENIGLFVVITHSRRLINHAIAELKTPFSKIHVGDENITFDEWLNRPFKPATVEELLNLKVKARETWKKIQKLTKD